MCCIGLCRSVLVTGNLGYCEYSVLDGGYLCYCEYFVLIEEIRFIVSTLCWLTDICFIVSIH